MESESPLIQAPFPALKTPEASPLKAYATGLRKRFILLLGLEANGREYYGWLEVSRDSVQSAIRMMRAMVVSNVLCRREGVRFISRSIHPRMARAVELSVCLDERIDSPGQLLPSDVARRWQSLHIWREHRQHSLIR